MLALLVSLGIAAAPQVPDAGAQTRWVTSAMAAVRASPSAQAPIIGWLESGNEVEQVGCVPSCQEREGWALLAPRGAVRTSVLTSLQPVGVPPWSTSYAYGHASSGAPVYACADKHSAIIRRERAERTLAFPQDEALLEQGWLRSAAGGYLPVEEVRLAGPRSELEGVRDPSGPVAFFRRRVWVPRPDGPPFLIERQAALPLLGLDARGRVRVPGAVVERAAVRLARPHPRPVEVPEKARWVHIDLAEQTLTAYQGDRLVLATLVSTGKPGFETRPGLYRVWFKVRHSTMNGRREPYHVEEVPDVMFFHGSDALHAAFWHDDFGAAVTHGCVNLSPRDADWLFEWATPVLPRGWHALRPLADDETLWVVVSKS
jgi:hypothetical protein